MENMEDDLTEEESLYYLEVSTRILEKSGSEWRVQQPGSLLQRRRHVGCGQWQPPDKGVGTVEILE